MRSYTSVRWTVDIRFHLAINLGHKSVLRKNARDRAIRIARMCTNERRPVNQQVNQPAGAFARFTDFTWRQR